MVLLGFKNPAYWSSWKNRFGLVDFPDTGKPVIWLHAVSVGEMNAASPLLVKLMEKYPAHAIVVTTVTPGGAQTLRLHFGDDIRHFYLPYDLPIFINRFLNTLKPQIAIIMETEIWPNLYYLCSQRDIPVLLINARLSEKSASKYRRVSALMRRTLENITIIAAQTQSDAERFLSFGVKDTSVSVTGNLKFDVTIPQSVSEQSESLKRYFSINRPLWIAASTQEGEDSIILDAHQRILDTYPDAVLILAPRHPERCSKVESLCAERGLSVRLRTDELPFMQEQQVYLLNTLGELQTHYAAAQVAFVGGSLVKRGGQNMLEPASLGIPVISGPYTYNFAEISNMLVEIGGLQKIHSASELAQLVCDYFADANLRHDAGEKARHFIESNKGNVVTTTALIDTFLNTGATYLKNEI